MLLPYWTNGCIDSMEGLLFESASTTPFHFINQNELSVNPSDAVVGLPYGGLNVPLGIEHLQQLGVRYFLASSTTVEQAAAADPALTEVASTGPWNTSYNGETLDTTWKVYKVADSAAGAAAGQPAGGVERGRRPARAAGWRRRSSWYDDPAGGTWCPPPTVPPTGTRVAGREHPSRRRCPSRPPRCPT